MPKKRQFIELEPAIIKMNSQGVAPVDTARDLGITKHTVYRTLRSNGLEFRHLKSRKMKAQEKLVAQSFGELGSVRKVSRATGIAESYIRKLLDRLGIDFRDKEKRQPIFQRGYLAIASGKEYKTRREALEGENLTKTDNVDYNWRLFKHHFKVRKRNKDKGWIWDEYT